MSGCFDLSATKLRHHFSLSNMSYDLSNCKLVSHTDTFISSSRSAVLVQP